MPDNTDFNSMQANVGLIYNPGTPEQIRTPSPAETSLMLTEQATQRMVQSSQMMQSTMGFTSPAAAAAMYGHQYRQQFQGIQAQQSINPYTAQAMSGNLPGAPQYGQGMLPSPLTMTPPSTGVFRPPAMLPNIAPIPPMYVPRGIPTPFQPQMPSPMFQTPYEQQMRARDIEADQRFAMMSQAPGFLGQAGAYGLGAGMGARFGARFGPMGALAGAAGGAAFAGLSGLAQGMGNVFQMPFGPAIERRQMGAALQNMSQNWVVSGPQLHPLGRGLNRQAGIQLAGGIQDLAEEGQFQQQTGGMFNREDLMRITRLAGNAGLMDMAQNTSQIKQQLRQVAQTVRDFMQLTNDPDVTSVIRQMGQLRQFGLNPQEMTQAAQNMRMFSQAAGTSIQGLQQIGGLPGAMTFQQAGLTAGTGFQYGNFAAASARQLVATGGINERQLALLGGVQGITQRDIQAQAAFQSLPLMGAAQAQYGPGGWGVNAGRVGNMGAGGAQGVVTGALQAMNQGVQQGGIGALAMFPLQQRMVQENAARMQTPQEMMAQRFTLAQQTGAQLGLRGEAGFALGAQLAFGPEVAEQMLVQAKTPGFFEAQRDLIRRQQRELALQQRSAIDEAGSGPLMRFLKSGFDSAGGGRVVSAGRGLARDVRRVGRGISRGIEDIGEAIEDRFNVPEGVLRTRISEEAAAAHAGLRRGGAQAEVVEGGKVKGGYGFSDVGFEDLQKAQKYAEGAGGVTGISETVGDVALQAFELTPVGWGLGLAEAGYEFVTGKPANIIGTLQGGALSATMTPQQRKNVMSGYAVAAAESVRISKKAAKEGGVRKFVDQATSAINKTLGSNTKVSSFEVLSYASTALGEKAKDRAGLFSTTPLSPADRKAALIEGYRKAGVSNPEEAVNQMSESELDTIYAQMNSGAKASDPDVAKALQETETEGAKVHQKDIRRAVERRTESLDAQMEELKGVGGLGEEAIAFASQIKSEEFAGIAAMVAGGVGGKGSGAALQSMKEKFLKGGGTIAQWDKKLADWQDVVAEKRAKGELTPEVEEQLRGAYQGGFFTEGATAGSMTAWARGAKEKGLTEGVGSQSYLASLEPYVSSEKLVGLLQGEEKLTAGAVAGLFDEEALRKMEKEGPAGKKRAAMFRAARTGTGKKKEQALLAIQEEAVRSRPEGEVEDVSATPATGKEAQELERSDKAMGDMSVLFQDFKPAAKEFREGANLLKQAMESQLMNEMRKG